MKRIRVARGFIITGLVLAIIGVVFGTLFVLGSFATRNLIIQIISPEGYVPQFDRNCFITFINNSDEILAQIDAMPEDTMEFPTLIVDLFYSIFTITSIWLAINLAFLIASLVLISIANSKVTSLKTRKNIVATAVLSLLAGIFGTIFPIVSAILLFTVSEKDLTVTE